MTWRIFYESFGHVIALIAGCFAYARMQRFHKLLFLQILIYAFSYVSSYLVLAYQRAQHLPLNNLWILNSYSALETFCLLLAFTTQIRQKREKRILALFVLPYLVLFVYDWSQNSIYSFYSLSFYAECVLLILVYSYLLYSIIHRHPTEWKTKPETWMVIGLLLYYAGTAPYMALFNALNDSHSKLLHILHLIINDLLCNTRYLLLALGFWLLYKQNKPLQRL
jgi:hypothetical protein